MISLIHFISSSKLLKESEKTVLMLGGEDEAPEMVRAQRDFYRLEVDYYRVEAIKFGFFCAGVVLSAYPIYLLWRLFNGNPT
jgi:hypothetical protein